MNIDLNFSYMMEKVDLVLVGAEGVVESGGIINKVSQVWPRISLVCRVWSLLWSQILY